MLIQMEAWQEFGIMNRVGTYGPCPPPTMSSACLLSVENFSQRISLIREVRNEEIKENNQRRLNNGQKVVYKGPANC